MSPLSKLTCGIIYTDAFQRYLESVHAEQFEDNPQQILTFDYVRCLTGPQKGKAWWQLTWTPLEASPEYRRHLIGRVPVYIPKPVSQGLRERCLDFKDGHVVVLP
ncbi:hypothetical protein FEM03_07775 [Phragmitibacter flavus]|uniref:Uncharacterized protein n=1 Tax=Phragmitibacter flavus TaxID=2576071 RepID=A0A5R8KGH7_9BACT|nr:hypothetical protein [Phragmitibacter flavus]TLD71417.1 hypothetical protein FEM03_07775 [Phragmitibacter flavus]